MANYITLILIHKIALDRDREHLEINDLCQNGQRPDLHKEFEKFPPCNTNAPLTKSSVTSDKINISIPLDRLHYQHLQKTFLLSEFSLSSIENIDSRTRQQNKTKISLKKRDPKKYILRADIHEDKTLSEFYKQEKRMVTYFGKGNALRVKSKTKI